MKNMFFIKKALLSALSLVLIAAMALGFTACGEKTGKDSPEPSQSANINAESATELGKGQRVFDFEVKDKDGSTLKFKIKTDAETVGAALAENKLISGADSEYGLMVDTVNGIKYDYTADKMYWSFYVNGEYASTGVDQTKIESGASYSFVATAA